ncbi:MAG: thermonuclease family protein [Methanobacteriaceae archaeon]
MKSKASVTIILIIIIGIVFVSGSIIINNNGQNNLDNVDNGIFATIWSLGNNITYGNAFSHKNATDNNNSNGEKPNHFEEEGYCDYVVDGDTLNVEGVGRIRLVGVNTPERGEAGYIEAKKYVEENCLGKTVYLDIDNEKRTDKYGRILAVVYVKNQSINQQLLKLNYAEVMFIPPSEFNPYTWN